MRKYLLCFLLLGTCCSLYAQLKITGIVVDAQNQAPLPFVNIGIAQKNLGTISSEEGSFSIEVPAQYINDTLTFSMVGYHELKQAVANAQDKKRFLLKPLPVGLGQVTVSVKKMKERKYGLSSNPVVHFWDASVNQNDIFEIAKLIKTGKGTSKITSVNLLIGQERNDSGTFRINFYEYDGHRPGNRINTKSILQTHAIKQGWLRFDLATHGVYVSGNVIVAIEFLPTGKPNAPIVYEIKPGGGGKSYVRTNSLGTWQVPPHQYRMFVTALSGDATVPDEEQTEKELAPSFRFYSSIVSDSFSIFARLPEGNTTSLCDRQVIYLLDANLYFESVADSLSRIKMEQPILIGIGYSNFVEMDRLRDRDYTYPAALASDSFKLSGGADKFYRFFKEELVPFVEKKYNIRQYDRTIMGHSLGGYFALYSLYKDLESPSPVFQNYVAASPSVDYHDGYLTKQFDKVKPGVPLSLRSVYISWGSMEDEPGPVKYSDLVGDLVNTLSGKKFDTALRIDKMLYPFASHMETALPGFYRGLHIGIK